MTKHSALSSRSWGMSSGILRISFKTTPDSLTRSSSFSSFAASAGSSRVQVRSITNGVFIKSSDAQQVMEGQFDAHEAIAISRHGRDHDGRDDGHGLAGGRCRGPHGPNVPRAIPSLRDSGRNADASSTPLHMEAGPSVPGPTCNGGQRVPNIHPPRRNLELEAVHTPHSGSAVAGSRCTPKSGLNSARQQRLRAVRHTSNSVSSLCLPFRGWAIAFFQRGQDYCSVSISRGKVTGVFDLKRPQPAPIAHFHVQAETTSKGSPSFLLQLQQIPFVAVQVFENCDRSVRLLARFLAELYISRLHFNVVTPEIVGVEEKKDSSSGLVANATALFGC